MNKRLFVLAVILFNVLPVSSQSVDEWAILGDFVKQRVFPATAVATDTLGFVIGGYSSTLFSAPTSTCEVIRLGANGITQAEIAQMTQPRAEFPLLVENDTALIAIGGFTRQGGVSDVVERYSIRHNRWEPIGKLQTGRRQHSASWISSHEFLVIGGRMSNLSTLRSAEVFDVRSGTSRVIAEYPFQVNGSVSQRVDGDVALYFGGRSGGENSARSPDIYWYDVDANRWIQYARMPSGREVPLAVELRSGVVVAAGGSFNETPARFTSEILRISSSQCNKIADMPFGVVYAGIAEFRANEVIVAGGWLSSLQSNIKTCAINAVTGEVRLLPDLNIERRYTRALCLRRSDGGRQQLAAFVVGGVRSNGQVTQTIEYIYDTGCTPTSIIAPTLSVNGDARIANGEIHLTTTNQFSSGSVWRRYNGTVNSSGFHHQVVARFADGDNRGELDGTSPGADGITFVIQKQGPEALGLFGRGIGYNGIRDALAIEFDTFINPQNSDPPTNHLAVMKPVDRFVESFHNSRSTLAQTESIPEVNADGKPFLLDYQYANGRLSVTLSTNGNVSTPSLVVDNLNVDSLLGLAPGEDYWIGFTSATGRAVQQHVIERWFDAPCGSVVLTSVNEGESPLPFRTEPLVAPMPVQSFAAITLPNGYGAPVELAVYTVDGVLVAKQDIDPWATTLTFDARELSSGLYIVRYTGTGGTASFTMPVVR